MSTPDDELVGLLADAVAAAPPRGLDTGVMHAALAARPSGNVIAALGGGHAAHPGAAYVQTIAELDDVLSSASSGVTIEPYGWSVVQLMTHLLGIERYFGRQLGLWEHRIDERLEHDHLAVTDADVRAAVGGDLDEVVARWRQATADIGAHVIALDPDQLRERITFHMLDTRVSTALVVRVFEVWTHIEDLCRALHREPPQLDAARLHLMTPVAVRAVPLGMAIANLDGSNKTARLVLTGRGGGVWNQSLQVGVDAGEPNVTIVADAVEFCRLAAQRLSPDALDAEVEGPIELALDVLRGASAFAA